MKRCEENKKKEEEKQFLKNKRKRVDDDEGELNVSCLFTNDLVEQRCEKIIKNNSFWKSETLKTGGYDPRREEKMKYFDPHVIEYQEQRITIRDMTYEEMLLSFKNKNNFKNDKNLNKNDNKNFVYRKEINNTNRQDHDFMINNDNSFKNYDKINRNTIDYGKNEFINNNDFYKNSNYYRNDSQNEINSNKFNSERNIQNSYIDDNFYPKSNKSENRTSSNFYKDTIKTLDNHCKNDKNYNNFNTEYDSFTGEDLLKKEIIQEKQTITTFADYQKMYKKNITDDECDSEESQSSSEDNQKYESVTDLMIKVLDIEDDNKVLEKKRRKELDKNIEKYLQEVKQKEKTSSDTSGEIILINYIDEKKNEYDNKKDIDIYLKQINTDEFNINYIDKSNDDKKFSDAKSENQDTLDIKKTMTENNSKNFGNYDESMKSDYSYDKNIDEINSQNQIKEVVSDTIISEKENEKIYEEPELKKIETLDNENNINKNIEVDTFIPENKKSETESILKEKSLKSKSSQEIKKISFSKDPDLNNKIQKVESTFELHNNKSILNNTNDINKIEPLEYKNNSQKEKEKSKTENNDENKHSTNKSSNISDNKITDKGLNSINKFNLQNTKNTEERKINYNNSKKEPTKDEYLDRKNNKRVNFDYFSAENFNKEQLNKEKRNDLKIENKSKFEKEKTIISNNVININEVNKPYDHKDTPLKLHQNSDKIQYLTSDTYSNLSSLITKNQTIIKNDFSNSHNNNKSNNLNKNKEKNNFIPIHNNINESNELQTIKIPQSPKIGLNNIFSDIKNNYEEIFKLRFSQSMNNLESRVELKKNYKNLIENLKNNIPLDIAFNFSQGKKIFMVLDIDNTFLHAETVKDACSLKNIINYAKALNIRRHLIYLNYKDRDFQMSFIFRKYIKEFFHKFDKYTNFYINSKGINSYVEKIIDKLSLEFNIKIPKDRIQARRENENGKSLDSFSDYKKNPQDFLQNCIIVDDKPENWCSVLGNVITSHKFVSFSSENIVEKDLQEKLIEIFPSYINFADIRKKDIIKINNPELKYENNAPVVLEFEHSFNSQFKYLNEMFEIIYKISMITNCKYIFKIDLHFLFFNF